jgi:YbbR domain-containing protein
MRTVYSAIFNNLFIKIIALFLAAITWAYIAAQLYNQAAELKETSQTVVAIADKNVIVKRVPVHINLSGAPDKRYKIAIDRIKVSPSEYVISGPLERVENVSFVTTEPISVDSVTKTVRKDVRLKDIEGLNIDKEQLFSVTVPIVRKRTR